MAMWNPWRGCRRYSEGCRYCYLHKSDLKKGIDTEHVIKTRNFYAPIAKKRSGADTIVSGQVVYLCFSSDFLIEDADSWRNECWQMIKARSDLHFIFLTKRIERFMDCVPPDWGNGYDNVTVGCTVENQACADVRLSIFHQLPIKHKNIICQPLLDAVDLTPYLESVANRIETPALLITAGYCASVNSAWHRAFISSLDNAAHISSKMTEHTLCPYGFRAARQRKQTLIFNCGELSQPPHPNIYTH